MMFMLFRLMCKTNARQYRQTSRDQSLNSLLAPAFGDKFSIASHRPLKSIKLKTYVFPFYKEPPHTRSKYVLHVFVVLFCLHTFVGTAKHNMGSLVAGFIRAFAHLMLRCSICRHIRFPQNVSHCLNSLIKQVKHGMSCLTPASDSFLCRFWMMP